LVVPEIVDKAGFYSQQPGISGAFSHLFFHSNFVHLMGNMIFLAAVGVAVELATGWLRFSVVFLLSGLLGAAIFWLSSRSVELPPLVGASGCIAGCATYYTLRYTSLRVPLAPKRSASVLVITCVWLGFQVLGAFVTLAEPQHRSSFFAHLGGAMCGLLLGILFKAPDLGSQRLGHEVLDRLNDSGLFAQIEFAKKHIREHPEDVEMHLKLAEAYQKTDEKEEEVKTLMSVLFRLEGEQKESAVSRLLDLNVAEKIPPIKRRQLADGVSEESARRLLLTIVNLPKNDNQRPDALLELATLLRESQPERAAEFITTLVEDYPAHPAADLAEKRGLI
jgi:membrane associated rhomboid family serine protease